MQVGTMNIDKTMMPSFLIGSNYPTRQYSFMQETLGQALANQNAIRGQAIQNTQQNPQQATQPVNGVQ